MTAFIEIAGVFYAIGYFICLWRTASPGSLRIRSKHL